MADYRIDGVEDLQLHHFYRAIEGEASDQSHVLGAMAASQAGEVFLEDDVENPVHALDPAVPPDGFGGPFRGEGGRGDEVAGCPLGYRLKDKTPTVPPGWVAGLHGKRWGPVAMLWTAPTTGIAMCPAAETSA